MVLRICKYCNNLEHDCSCEDRYCTKCGHIEDGSFCDCYDWGGDYGFYWEDPSFIEETK